MRLKALLCIYRLAYVSNRICDRASLFTMQHSNSSGDSASELPGDLAIDSILDASRIASWNINITSGELV